MNHRTILPCCCTLLVLAMPVAGAAAAEKPFIDNMPVLTSDPDRPGAKKWERPNFNRAAYKSVMLEPLTIMISPDSKYKDLDADELKALSDQFRETVVKTLAPEFPVVGKPGPGVLYVRAAITNVKLEQKKRGLLGYTPIGFVVTTVADAAGARISLRQAVLQIEMLDSVSKQRLGVLVDSAPTPPGSETLSWDSIRHTLEYYAQRFKARMQGGSNAPGSREQKKGG